MEGRNVALISGFLTALTLFALQTGYFLPGAVAMVANGLLTLWVGPQFWKRAVGGVMTAFGLFWILVLALGFVAAALSARQIALLVGGALLVAGLQIARRMPQRRKLGFLLAGTGGLLMAYGLGHIG